MIVADLSNDATYGEVLFEMFGRRVIGVQIGRLGDGMTFERRRVKNGAMPVYNVGRTFLLELLLGKVARPSHSSHSPKRQKLGAPMSNLRRSNPNRRESGMVYKCPVRAA